MTRNELLNTSSQTLKPFRDQLTALEFDTLRMKTLRPAYAETYEADAAKIEAKILAAAERCRHAVKPPRP